MVRAMNEKEGEEHPLKHAIIDLKLIQEKTVVDFTTKNFTLLFKRLDLSEDFLKYPSAQWKYQPGFNAAKTFISMLAVTNDHGEQGVAPIENFSGRLPKDKDHLQFAPNVVSDHSKKFPDTLQGTILGSNE